MKSLHSLNADIDIDNHWGGDIVWDEMAEQIELLFSQGYKIFVGNNPGVLQGKGYDGMDVILISQISHPTRGSCNRTIWAVKYSDFSGRLPGPAPGGRDGRDGPIIRKEIQ